MRAIEVTIQNLIGSGMAPKTENNPYLGFVYTSFQERATKVSHGHTAAEAAVHGDTVRSAPPPPSLPSPTFSALHACARCG